MNMTRTRRTILVLILLCGGISVVWGSYLAHISPYGMGDFKGVYNGARCLLQHGDPYKEDEPLRALRVYQAEGGGQPRHSDALRQILTLNVYFPPTFIIIAPFAMLPWGLACLLWMSLTAGVYILAALLMWNFGADSAPVLSGGLICFVLANSEILIATGNTAGIAVSLCLVAVWCFFRERFVPAGILCLAVSLAMKPHDAGLVWLYLLLAGGVCRRRALQTFLVTVVLGLASILWVTPVAPHWMQELHSILLAASAPGGSSNPGPTSPVGSNGANMIIDLQTAISVFRDDPRFYNWVTYLVCGALLLVWSMRTLRLRFSQRRAWLALAAVLPLTMLVSYHRPYDAKLLLLAVPACAMLWAEDGPVRWVALLVTTAAIVFTGDITLTILKILTNNLHLSTAGLSGQILTTVLMRPVPLILLAMCIFYLWAYLRRDSERG